jgi:hypothetical protein
MMSEERRICKSWIEKPRKSRQQTAAGVSNSHFPALWTFTTSVRQMDAPGSSLLS